MRALERLLELCFEEYSEEKWVRYVRDILIIAATEAEKRGLSIAGLRTAIEAGDRGDKLTYEFALNNQLNDWEK